MKSFNERYKAIIGEEIKMLPDQAPLEHFVHHNNLHHFESVLFEQAVEKGYLDYGKSPYMPLSYYRSKAKIGEINQKAFCAALASNEIKVEWELENYIFNSLYSYKDIEQIEFYIAEGMCQDLDSGLWKSMNKKEHALWDLIKKLEIKQPPQQYPDFHVNRSPNKTSLSIIPFLSVMLDQGQAEFQLANHQRENVWATFLSYLGSIFDKELLHQHLEDIPVCRDQVEMMLEKKLKDYSDQELIEKLRLELNMLPGWAGMVYKMSKNKEVIPRREVYMTLEDYLLMRLILNEIYTLNPKAQFTQVNPDLLIKMNVFNFLATQEKNEEKLDDVFSLFTDISPLKLRRIFQQAYEITYQEKILSGISRKTIEKIGESKYQMFFCIDDREASFRRYLEEVSQGAIATFGVAGFFGFDMMYQKVGEPRARRLCPPAASPQYLIKESGNSYKFKFARFIHYSHSSFIRSATAGFLTTPWRTLEFKLHLYAPRIKRKFIENMSFTKLDQIHYESEHKIENGFKLGYNLQELAQRVAGILRGAGLVKDFAPYVLMIGHGHDSFNNPHVSAYRCGACSGANAYPNAKVFARTANDPKIREILAKDFDLHIPANTYFVGGYHDTCNDDVKLFDIELEKMNEQDQKELKAMLLQARELNAKERCKKFYQTPKNISPVKALRFVEERAWRIAEPRPELNHATNSLCIVGRRELTKDLFLDRRAFLVSYDPQIDGDSAILAGLLGAVIPVCAGINLEYYFSKVDTENYGSGSKTSHNVTGLMGVMNGIRGDLRTGLVWQMVEYHDPLRILFVIEAYQEQIEKIMQQNEQVKNLITNYWISLALVNPKDHSDITVYKNNQFVTADLPESAINTYESSDKVPTGLDTPVDIAYLKGLKHG